MKFLKCGLLAAAIATLFVQQAQATAFNLNYSAHVSEFSYGTGTFEGRHINYAGLYRLGPLQGGIQVGDTFHVTLTLDQPFNIGLSPDRTWIMAFVLDPVGFPGAPNITTGQFNFYTGGPGGTLVRSFSNDYTTNPGAGNLGSFSDVDPVTGNFSFDYFTDDFTIIQLGMMQTVNDLNFQIQLVSAAVVPEPSTLALFAAALASLAGLGCLRRTRKVS